MAIKIEGKITSYEVVSKDEAKPAESNVVHMHEQLERPDILLGSTYKIKTPLTEHALYVTINDMVLNQGTPHEKRRPFEIFINSKSMDHFQWVVAMTRVISAVFRKGGDVTFLIEELRSVFDPRGGYFKKGRYTPSLVAELGDVIGANATGGDAERADAFIATLMEIVAATGVERRLSALGVSHNDLPRMAEDAMKVERLMRNNPRAVTYEDALRMYGEVL